MEQKFCINRIAMCKEIVFEGIYMYLQTRSLFDRSLSFLNDDEK